MSMLDFFKRILLIIFILIVCASFWYLRHVWILAFMGVIVAVGVNQPSFWLQSRFGMNRGLATLLSFVAISIGTYFLSLLVFVPIFREITRLIAGLPTLIRDAIAGYEVLVKTTPYIGEVLPNPFDSATGEFAFTSDLVSEIRSLSQNVFEAGIPIVGAGVNLVVGIFGNFIIILLVAIYLLVDPLSLIHASLYLVPQTYQARLVEIWNELFKTISNWLRVQFTAIVITGILVWVILGLILNMPNALTVAMFAGFATFIPNIGIFLPLIPITLFQLADDPSRLILVVPAYLIIQTVESNILTPSIVKSQMRIPASALTVFQVVAAIVFGPYGIILAIPLLATFVVLVRELYSFDILGLGGRAIAVSTRPDGYITADFFTKEELPDDPPQGRHLFPMTWFFSGRTPRPESARVAGENKQVIEPSPIDHPDST